MDRLISFRTLKAKTLIWCLYAMLLGIVSTVIWTKSNKAWDDYLRHSYHIGYELYANITEGENEPHGVQTKLINKLPTLKKTVYSTIVSISPHQSSPIENANLQLLFQSPELQFPIAKLYQNPTATPPQQLGKVIEFIAGFCSEATLYVQNADQSWLQIEGKEVWSCQNAPRDNRLLALLLLAIGMAILIVQIDETSALFSNFAKALKRQGKLGGHRLFEKEGPQELQDTIQTVNDYFVSERDKLAKRAMVMSGVSHDLGTPATRLRLRTALIEDEELRKKLETDIDQMTSMIESVLTYTRSEIDSEDVHKLSLTSLVESVVSDYSDTGRPVQFIETPNNEIQTGTSLFNAKKHTTKISSEDARRVLVHGRPLSLRRAITNLIDNALKYGRRAKVSIEATSATATIIIEDEGNALSSQELDALVAPFVRGDNSDYIEGTGLGLTIVSTIANQHQGSLHFEKATSGVRARLTIRRTHR